MSETLIPEGEDRAAAECAKRIADLIAEDAKAPKAAAKAPSKTPVKKTAK